MRAPVYYFEYRLGFHPDILAIGLLQRPVFTNGCFDMFHPGHLHVIRHASLKAQEDGSPLVVGVNSDRSVRALKGDSRPIWNERDRAEVVASIKGVDYVVVFEETTPWELMGVLHPRLVVKGGDYTEHRVVTVDGCGVDVVPLLPGWSTTSMIERIRGQQV